MKAVEAEILSRVSPDRQTSEESEIIKFVQDHHSQIETNVYGVIREINSRVVNGNVTASHEIHETLYKHFLYPLIKCLKNYFKKTNTKYRKIVILADNLDIAWKASNYLELQSGLITSLINIDDKIKHLLVDRNDNPIGLKHLVFLRTDIYKYILENTIESDKITTQTQEISWENHPELLRKMIENRFKHVLNLNTQSDIEHTWDEFFDFVKSGHPYDEIDKITTRRPRDVLYFISKLLESAVNSNRRKVGSDDLAYAIESYATFLNQNLIEELKPRFSEIGMIFSALQKYHGKNLEYGLFMNILDDFKYDRARKDEVFEALFENKYIVEYNQKNDAPISDIDTFRTKLKEKRFIFFKNKLYVIAHAKYYFVKNKRFSLF